MTDKVSLRQLCAGTSVDIITLAFINNFYGPKDPSKIDITLDFNGYLCQAPNQTQKAAGMTGLLDCTIDGFAAQVAACQAQGKKVLISAGGASANLSIPSEKAAKEVAQTLWDMFLGGTGLKGKGVRPFGDVVLDGFDIDNEDEKNAGTLFPLISTLRNLTKKDKLKKYYFSAAPICALPDPEIPVSSLLNQIDFWNVQFYNARACQLGTGNGFLNSIKTWSQNLLGKRKLACSTCKVPQGAFNVNGNNITYPRLLIGSRAFDPGLGPSGYVNITQYRAILKDVAKLNLPNLAGAMFWEGAFLYKEKGLVEGKNRTFAQIAKSVLKAT
jgi:chitinase